MTTHDPQVSPPEYLGCFVDDPQDRILALAYTASDDMTPTVRENEYESVAVAPYPRQRIVGVLRGLLLREFFRFFVFRERRQGVLHEGRPA